MKRYVQIVAIALLALTFAAAAIAKLANPPMFQEQFARFSLPEWFVFVTAAVELVGAALVASFNDLRRRIGAALLTITMAVAASLHVIHDPLAMAGPAFLLMLLAGYVTLVPLSVAKNQSARGV